MEKKTFISRHILRQRWCTCPIALPARRTPQQSLPQLIEYHLRLSNVLEIISRSSCEPLYATNISHLNRKYFIMNILCIESFGPPPRNAEHNAALRLYTPQAWSPFWLLKPVSELRLSWSWTVMLLNDTNRKPITSITAVLLQFVTYLLTLSRTCLF
jgi:hypothetical protein